MANITFKGNPVHTIGELPDKGSKAPDFKLVKGDLSE
ncbi:MAG: lipid hydroperoxide peroxidase, partial [Bacteroidia bacterium]|nr:lipid hydroperoxide peroxidase [Bacteroidia bacterium]